MRYDVFRHYYGRPIIQTGPLSGCLNFPTHKHEKVNTRQVGLTRAKMLANSCVCHAQVVEANTATVVYSNDKAPGLPEGWVYEEWDGRR